MTNKTKTVIYLVVFILFITGAVLTYNYMSTRYKAENQLQANPDINESENDTNSPSVTAGI